jgi:hypothetical protein
VDNVFPALEREIEMGRHSLIVPLVVIIGFIGTPARAEPAESVRYLATLAKFTASAGTLIRADRANYLATLRGCKRDALCRSATVRAQHRLYDALAPCAPARVACVATRIERHRMELHQAM